MDLNAVVKNAVEAIAKSGDIEKTIEAKISETIQRVIADGIAPVDGVATSQSAPSRAATWS